MRSVTIPETVKSIGSGAFENCSSLSRIAIPKAVTSIGSDAFSGCTGLTSVYLEDVEAWCNIKFGSNSANPMSDADNIYLSGELFTELVIPESVTRIRSFAFSGCTGLTSITIPDSVTSIADYAFSGCAGLTSITIPDSVTSIGKSAFYGCTGLTSMTIPFVGRQKDGTSNTHFGYIFGADYGGENDDYVPDTLETVIITGGASIGEEAFWRCTGLKSITIPDSVTSIGKSALYGCTGLTSMTIPFVGSDKYGTSSTHFGYIFGADDYYDENADYVPETLKTVIITGVITGGSIIGRSAFEGCTALTSITISNSVMIIGEFAFEGCTGLMSIIIPDSVTSIGFYAFYGCAGLTDVYYTGTEEEWAAIGVDSSNSSLTNATIHYNYGKE